MSTQPTVSGNTPEERELLRRESISIKLKTFYGSDKGRQNKANALTKRWEKPEEHKKQSERTKASWETRRGTSDGQKESTPPEEEQSLAPRLQQANKRRSETLKAFWGTEEGKQKKSAASKSSWTPERKKTAAERMRQRMAKLNAAAAGRPATKKNIYAEAHRLRETLPQPSWSKIALKLLPKECRQKGARKTGESLRVNVTRYFGRKRAL